MKLERRYASGLEIRTEGEQPIITGYAAVFNQSTRIGGKKFGWNEVVKPGAFRRALQENQDVRALVEHDPARIIGRRSANTLTLTEDDHGLRYSVTPPDTQIARDLLTSIKRGDISGSSFGFQVVTDNWRTVNGEDVREITDVNLFDVSPVAFPAYEGTSVSARSLLSEDEDERYVRALFRAQRGLALSDEDKKLLDDVRIWLEKSATPPTIDPAIRLELDRRKRELQLKKYAA